MAICYITGILTCRHVLFWGKVKKVRSNSVRKWNIWKYANESITQRKIIIKTNIVKQFDVCLFTFVVVLWCIKITLSEVYAADGGVEITQLVVVADMVNYTKYDVTITRQNDVIGYKQDN